MEEIESQKITIEKNGKEVECDLLFTFDSEDTGKAYMAYTDYSKDEEGRNNIYVQSYDPVFERIENVTDPRELAMVDDVIKEIRNEIQM